MAKKAAPPVKSLNPVYLLKIFSVEYFLLSNPKKLEREFQIKVINVPDLNINFNINVNFVFGTEQKIIQCQVTLSADTFKEQTTINLVQMEIAFDYEISNYHEFMDGGRPTFTQDFLAHLANVSISTSRGILISKLSITYLQSLILPIVNTAKPEVIEHFAPKT